MENEEISSEELLLDQIGLVIIDYQNQLRQIFEKLSDQQLQNIPKMLNESHKNCIGFRVTQYDEVAQLAEAEFDFRRILNRARELNLDCFCVTCGGKCKGENYHSHIYPEIPKEVLRINEMSREDLIEEVIKLRNLSK